MKKLPLAPILVAAYANLAFLANNIAYSTLLDSWRVFLSALTLATIILLIFRLLLRDWRRGALVSAFCVFFFFSYGHLANALTWPWLAENPLLKHGLLLAGWGVIWGVGVWKTRRMDGDKLGATLKVVNLVSLFAVIFPVLQLAGYYLGASYYGTDAREPVAEQTPLAEGDGAAVVNPEKIYPDIYYLIFDSYGRDDLLESFFNWDNTSFLGALEEMGFYVAYCSRSNYAQTRLSIASSLNFQYVEEIYTDIKPGSTDLLPLNNMIKKNKVVKILARFGYTFIAFDSGFQGTQITKADVYISPYVGPYRIVNPNEYESIFLQTTVLTILADFYGRDTEKRDHTMAMIEGLEAIHQYPSPKFVFVHFLIPHPPFVFGRQGDRVPADVEYKRGYRNQVRFTNTQILSIVQAIMEGSPEPPIVIIQADHGPTAWDDHHENRMKILNAYYLPGGGNEDLWPSISPVNTFRVVVNRYFWKEIFELLPDISYYSEYRDPYNFTIIDETRSGCPTSPAP